MISIDMNGAGVTKISRTAYAGVEEMVFDGARAVTPQTAGKSCSYSGIDAGGYVRRMEASFVFNPCSDPANVSAVLVSQANGLSQVQQITASCIHIVCTPFGLQVTSFNGGAYTIHSVLPHSAPLLCDGAAVNHVWAMPQAHSVIVKRPCGSIVEVAAPNVGRLGGHLFQFEAYRYTQAGSFAIFTGASCER